MNLYRLSLQHFTFLAPLIPHSSLMFPTRIGVPESEQFLPATRQCAAQFMDLIIIVSKVFDRAPVGWICEIKL